MFFSGKSFAAFLPFSVSRDFFRVHIFQRLFSGAENILAFLWQRQSFYYWPFHVQSDNKYQIRIFQRIICVCCI